MKWLVEGWHWYLDGWKNYTNFSGRSRRKAYWFFTLFHYVILIPSLVVVLSVFKNIPFRIIVGIYLFASIVPDVAVTVRRFHDTDHDWAWLYVPMIFKINILFEDSQPAENKYGPDPKKEERTFLDLPPEAFDADIYQLSK